MRVGKISLRSVSVQDITIDALKLAILVLMCRYIFTKSRLLAKVKVKSIKYHESNLYIFISKSSEGQDQHKSISRSNFKQECLSSEGV